MEAHCFEGGRAVAPEPGVVRRGLGGGRSEEHTSELQSRLHLVCRLLLEKKKEDMSPLARQPGVLVPAPGVLVAAHGPIPVGVAGVGCSDIAHVLSSRVATSVAVPAQVT